MIILPWGKYDYKCLPTGIADSSDTLQHNMNDLFHHFELIRDYIYEILILTKRYWEYNVQKLELTLNKMKGKGLDGILEGIYFDRPEWII